MTSSAISLLTTVTAPAPKANTADQGGMSSKKDAASFSEKLQKADKAQGNKDSLATGSDPKAIKPKSPQDSKTSASTNKLSSPATDSTSAGKTANPKEVVASEVIQEAYVTAIPVSSSPAPSILTKPVASETAVKPVKDDEAVTPPDAVLPVVLAPTPVNDFAALAAAQVQPQAQASDSKDPEAGADNMLGTSILASISMGKSLEKAPSGNKLVDTPAKASAELGTPVRDDAAPEIVTNASLTPAQAAKATQVSAEPDVTASSPVLQKTAESTPIKASIDISSDAKSGDNQARLDSLGSTSPMAASAQTSVSQGGATGSTTATLQTPVSNPEWAKSLGQQLVNFHLKGDQNVQLHLNPSNLGPMTITLNVNEHLQATAHFASHSGQVRSALEQGIGQLREAMAQQGISLGETSVGEQRQQGFAQSDQGQSHRGNIQQLPGMTVVADELASLPAASVVGEGEISTYA